MADDAKTTGYLERRILHKMRVGGDEKPKASNRGPTFFSINAGDIEGWHGVSRASVRRAFQSLHEKDLIIPVEEAPDRHNYEDLYPAEDGRVQSWTLTFEGNKEIGRLESEYFEELEDLLKRYGRHPVQVKERFK